MFTPRFGCYKYFFHLTTTGKWCKLSPKSVRECVCVCVCGLYNLFKRPPKHGKLYRIDTCVVCACMHICMSGVGNFPHYISHIHYLNNFSSNIFLHNKLCCFDIILIRELYKNVCTEFAVMCTERILRFFFF